MTYRDARGRFMSKQQFEQTERRRRLALVGVGVGLLAATVFVFFLKF